MLKIKLARFGKKGQPHYRIVVNEAKSKRDGKYVVKLGEYAPTHSPKILTLDLKEYANWLAKGAQPTPTVLSLAKRVESGNPFPKKPKRASKKSIAKKAAESQKVVEKEVKPAIVESESQTNPEVTEAEQTEVQPE